MFAAHPISSGSCPEINLYMLIEKKVAEL